MIQIKKTFTCLFISVIITSCTQKKTSHNELIIGKWQKDSVLNHDNGEDFLIKLSENENFYVGSLSNRYYLQFASYNEAFLYREQDTMNKETSSFKILNDTIFFGSFGDVQIISLTEKNLVTKKEIQKEYIDTSIEHPRQFITTYYTRK